MVQLDFGQGEGTGKTRALLAYSAFSLFPSGSVSCHIAVRHVCVRFTPAVSDYCFSSQPFKITDFYYCAA